MKTVKIKDLARRYGVNEKDMIAELTEQGIDIDKKNNEVICVQPVLIM